MASSVVVRSRQHQRPRKTRLQSTAMGDGRTMRAFFMPLLFLASPANPSNPYRENDKNSRCTLHTRFTFYYPVQTTQAIKSQENRRAVIIFQSVHILTQPLLARFWHWRCPDISADNSCLGKSSPVTGLDGVLRRFILRQCSSRHGGLGEFILTTIYFHSWSLHASNVSRATFTSRTNVVLNESQLKTNERVVEIIHLLGKRFHLYLRHFSLTPP
ncbi:hypothetical protein C8J57DRAFT_1726506 [Mycena rebaudengoi]|nr:hypothetical protein C8J57DRAFT_1726506 [Mycena rebaudengoi]